MKICVSIKATDEIAPLVKAGADEFYCGVIPWQWRKRYKGFFLNRREDIKCNYSSYKELKVSISLARELGRPVYVTFNAPFYPQILYPELEKIIIKVLSFRPAGVIVGDPGLLLWLKEKGINANIVLSAEFGIFNLYDVKCALGLNNNIKRIVFQRYLSIPEMKDIISHHPNYDYEAFVLDERCPFAGPYCFASHDRKLGENMCQSIMDAKPQILFAQRKPISYFNKVYENICLYYKRENFNSLFNIKGIELNEEDWPVNCGLCHLKALKKAGIKYLKIAGRARSLRFRVRMVEIAKKTASGQYNKDEIKELFVKHYRGSFKENCKYKHLCYY
ncbi:MAG: U32 family peptidase [Candidatus Margulisiibacteriota bacterium]